MVAGFATTAGGVLAAYVRMLKPHVQDIAGHFIACSVMAAPASLVIAKLMMPEIDQPETMGLTRTEIPKAGVNVFDALAAGTTDGLRLAAERRRDADRVHGAGRDAERRARLDRRARCSTRHAEPRSACSAGCSRRSPG